MNSQWRDFLQTRGAQFDEAGQTRFPAAPRSADPALCDLGHLGLIRVSGADALGFLQGQVTNDVRQVSVTHSQLAGYCNPKGRLLASFRIFRIDEALYLQLPRTQLDLVLKRLRMYVLRAQVALTDVTDDFTVIGLSGESAGDLLMAALPDLSSPPADFNDQIQSGELTLIRQAGTLPRFLILGPWPALTALWDRLAVQATPLDASYWTLLDIRAGLPTIQPETREAFVPQMVNLQRVDGVSFTKGCYTGQEIVARMQYLGKLKRRLYIGEVTLDRPPAPGEELFSPISESAQTAGTIVEACSLGDGRWAISAVAEIAAVADGRLSLGEGGPRLPLEEPPYGFPAT